MWKWSIVILYYVSEHKLIFRLSVASLLNTFCVFGPLKVEWPGKDGKHPRCPPQGNSKIHFIAYHLQFSCISYWVSAKRTNMETYLMFNHIKLYASDLKHGFLGTPQFLRSTLFWNFVDSEILCDMSSAPWWIIHAFHKIEDFSNHFQAISICVAYLFAGK